MTSPPFTDNLHTNANSDTEAQLRHERAQVSYFDRQDHAALRGKRWAAEAYEHKGGTMTSELPDTSMLIVDHERPMANDLSLRLGEFRMANYADVLNKASEVASQLSGIIRERKLFVKIGQKDHVYVDGWTTCGAMLGVVCRPLSCEESTEGEFVAVVEAVRASDGFVLGRGIASCGPDDRDWKSRTRQARRSMAQTRAAGKAMRLLFSWVMELAGYATTPFEEMDREPHENPTPDDAAPQVQPRGKRLNPKQGKPVAERVTKIVQVWQEKNKDPGDKTAWAVSYKRWVMDVCDRVFNPQKPAEWTEVDMATCERELGIDYGIPY